MKTPRNVFRTFSILFLALYVLMVMLFLEELETEEDGLARALDVGIIGLGIVFMSMQAVMAFLVGRPERRTLLERLFYVGLGVWFFLEVVLSYTWCFVTGADPLWEHTPFVVIFLVFNAAQFWALKKLGVLQSST